MTENEFLLIAETVAIITFCAFIGWEIWES